MSVKQQLIEALSEAAILMQVGWRPMKWISWVIYLLEALQEDANVGRYEEFLRNLRGAIDARLEDGRW